MLDSPLCPIDTGCRAAAASSLIAAFNLDGNLEALHAGTGPAPYVGSGVAVDPSATRVHGSGAYIIRGAAAESRIELPGVDALTDELTWMTWVRVAPPAQQAPAIYPRIIDHWAGDQDSRGCALSIGADPQGGGPSAPGQPFFECYAEDGNQYSAIGTMEIRDDTWHHVAGSWSTALGEIRFVVDGELLAALTFPPGTRVAPNADVMMLGGANRGYPGWESMAGYLDEVYLFRAALPVEVIQELAARPLTAADVP